jgi:acid phosphatase
MYFHNTGYGRELSASLGVPWVNASVAALNDESSSQQLHVSFTHRELPPTVITALGLYNNSAYTEANHVNGTMPENRITYNCARKSCEILHSSRISVLRKCRASVMDLMKEITIGILNNAGPQPLVNCQDGPGGAVQRNGSMTL